VAFVDFKVPEDIIKTCDRPNRIVIGRATTYKMSLRDAKAKYGDKWTGMSKDERKIALRDLAMAPKQEVADPVLLLPPGQQKIMNMLTRVVDREITKLKKTSIYSSKKYWDERHGEDETAKTSRVNNEWFLGYELLRGSIRASIPLDQRVLVLGCGLSSLEDDMWSDGYQSLVAVDYSPMCVDKRRKRHETRRAAACSSAPAAGSLTFEEQDIRSMPAYATGSFDCVLDKATLDTMYNIEVDGDDSVCRMLAEAYRVLAPGGQYVVVTHGAPHERVADLLGSPSAPYGWRLLGYDAIRRNTRTFHVFVLVKERVGGSDCGGLNARLLANLQQEVDRARAENAQLKIQAAGAGAAKEHGAFSS
jgi:SAM-dependent methyltransferase